MPLSAGARLGPYEILAPLGSGGMGDVYRARDARLGREVAIKILPERLADNAQALARFEREARAVAALSHPNILAVHDFGREQAVVFAVMELLEGETLERRIARENLSWNKALEIGAAIADGLSSAHAKGIVHRDLKPANIFVTRDGHVKIVDFGLARQDPFGGETRVFDPAAPGDTEPGAVLGTVGYMSPEQVRGEPADPRSDLFSLGCVLYEMLTGRRAFPGNTPAETLAAILRDQPTDLADSGRKIAPRVEAVVRRCLAKSPDERFQTARDLAFALREILGPSEVAAGTPSAYVPPTWAHRWPAALALALMVIVAAGLALDVAGLRTRLFRNGRPLVRSLAVLPMANLSGDPQQEYFADGITEQLIADLARLGQLRVISRTSAMAFKGTKKSLPQIARELGVDVVVDGSVTRVGPTMRLSAALIDGATDRQLWGESYERDVRDVLALQREIARTIARTIEVELSPTDRARIEGGGRIEPEAYEAYVKGQYYWNKAGEADLKEAVAQYQRALDVDPAYPPAWAGLADAYALIGYQNYLPPGDAFPKAKAAAMKALALDGTLAEPHASLGYIHTYFDWDFDAADTEFRRAIALNPNLVAAHHYYSVYLTAMLRPDDARKEIERARAIDPLSVAVASDMGFELYYDRRYDDATRMLRDAIAMNPRAALPHFWLARVYQAQGNHREAMTEFSASGPGVAQWPPALAGLGHLYAVSGKRAEAMKVIEQLDAKSRASFVSPYDAALVYVGLGDKKQALSGLSRCYDERANWLVWLLKDPRWDPIRSDTEFQQIVRRVGFPADAQARQPNGPA